MGTTFHHRKTAHINPAFVGAAQDSPVPRHLQALCAGFMQTSTLSYVLHAKRPIAVTPALRQRLERLAALLKFPTDQIFVDAPDREMQP